jgi:phosphatidate cytidylyltransferase
MLLQRILTAAVGIPITVYIIQFGGWLFALAIIGLALAAWREYGLMLRQKNIEIGMLGGMATTLLLLLSAWCGNAEEIILVIWIVLLWTLLRTLRTWQSNNQSFAPATFNLFGVIYIGFSFMHLILLRETSAPVLKPTLFTQMSFGTVYLWVAFLATWASDTFAYFIGSALGRHKLAPDISPKKSVEGFVGGVIGAILAVVVFGHFTAIPMIHRLVTGMLVGLVSPIGDLAESALKRFCGVKDSGSLLPGHGGVLDRFDSILFSVPVIYYYVRLIILQ